MKIAFLLYPVAHVKPNEDSSLWIMHELRRRGHRVFHCESRHLAWRNHTLEATLYEANTDLRHGFRPTPLSREPRDLGRFDCVFIRKEPPFNAEYLYSLELLNRIKTKAFVINDPQGITTSNEKLLTLDFSDLIPDTLVTQNVTAARHFIAHLKTQAVIKPLTEKSGVGLFLTSPQDPNLPSLLESATSRGREMVMIQRFVNVHRFGDKRIVILNGEPLGAFLRKPPRGDFRANLSVGGSMHRATLNAGDRRIVESLAPKLLEKGLWLVGIDVIGRFLTEINVTSPAGIPELYELEGKRLEKKIVDFIEAVLAGRRSAHAL